MGIGPIQIEHLDGRKISVGLTELASPNVAKVIKGQGLARDDLKKNYGDLFVNFDIVFPEEIDPWQKLQLWVALVDYPRPRPPLHYAIAPISAISLQESKGKEVPLDLPRKSQPAAIQLSVSTTSTETAMSRDPGP
jgi:DnaJ-class molecular chaperone